MIACFGLYKAYIYICIRNYEAMMNEKTYEPCAFVDEDGVAFEDWNEGEDGGIPDPELAGLPRNEYTGKLEPLRDKNGKIIKDLPAGYPGPKSMKIPFVRGYHEADGYGVSRCMPCYKATDDGALKICNDRSQYTKINEEYQLSDLDKASYIDDTVGKGY
jgi:hypothetical protein